MTDRRTLLLIDNDSSHAAIFRTALHDASEGAFQHQWVMTLAEGIEQLRAKGIWAIFLNLSLPDSQGIETFNRLSLAAPGIPTLVLAGAGENDIALDALRSGAKDYLLENHLDSYSSVLAARKLVSALNSKPYPVRDAALSYAIRDAEDVLHRIKMHHNV